LEVVPKLSTRLVPEQLDVLEVNRHISTLEKKYIDPIIIIQEQPFTDNGQGDRLLPGRILP
jgi:hypothetical protein